MKLLFLTPGCFDKGGISRYSRYQIKAWREILGEENVHVLSLLGPDENSFEEAFPVTFSAGGVAWMHKIRFTAMAAREAAIFRPAIIHSAHVNLSGMARVLAAFCGAASVLNTYGMEVWSGFRRDALWGLRHTCHVLSDCHFTARYLEQEGLRPTGSVEVLWDCVDVERFSPGPVRAEVSRKYHLPDPATGFNLLTFGRMSPDASHKGYERLYEVLKRIAPAAPSVRLIFAGKGGLADILRQRAEADGLSDRVFFTGMIHDDDLPGLYRSAHLFSLISDCGAGRGEGIPLTPLEAAGCGVPILVGNQDGSQEAVIEGINGHILDPFDLEAQAEAILALVREPERRAAMGRAARDRIEKEFAYPIFREKHRALLAQWFPATRRDGGKPAVH